jgi:hypothetical protein
MDDELRRLIRARDASPEDPGVARRAAAAAGRHGDRGLAVAGWQEVLRRAPGDDEADRRLDELGCELRFVQRDALGFEEFENKIDRAILVTAPALPGVFVARRPVSYQQFHRFLSAEGGRPESAKWIGAHAPLRRTPLDSWTFRGSSAASESYVLEASWLGASAYSRWAGGRLLTDQEWLHLTESSAAFDGFQETEGEWVYGERASRERPIACIWDTRFPAARSHHVRWVFEDICGEQVLFRYARDTWFAER